MRPYLIELYDKDFTKETLFPSNLIRMQNYVLTMNKPGSALFSVPKEASIALKSNFQKYKRIKVLRYSEAQGQYAPIWSGYIVDVFEGEVAFDIGCVGLLELFKKRYTSATKSLSGNGGTASLSLLDDTNASDDTAIIKGTTDYIETVDEEADVKPLLDVWEDIAKAEGGDFEITVDTNTMNFKQKIGTDKSSTLQLTYDINQLNASNLDFSKIRESGRQIVNRVHAYGKSSADVKLSVTVSDAASIAKYGLLEDTVSFDDAEDVTQLTALANGHLDAFKEEIDNPEIRALQKRTVTDITGATHTIGLDLDDIALGDIVSVKFNTDYTQFTENRRIVEIAVTVDGGGNEDIKLKLIKEDEKLEIITANEEADISKATEKLEKAFQKHTYR